MQEIETSTIFKCDWPGCGNTQKGSSGWFLLQRRGKFTVFGQWLEQVDLAEFEHFCGLECFHKRVSQITGRAM